MQTVDSNVSTTPILNICAPASREQKWRHMHFNIFQEYTHKGKSTFHHIWPSCNSIQEPNADIYVIFPVSLSPGWQRFKEILWGGPCKVNLLRYKWCWWKTLECFFWAWIEQLPCGVCQRILSIFLKISIDIKICSYIYSTFYLCWGYLVNCDFDPFLWGHISVCFWILVMKTQICGIKEVDDIL